LIGDDDDDDDDDSRRLNANSSTPKQP